MEFESLEEERMQAEKDRATKLQESLIMAVGGNMPAPEVKPSESALSTDEPEIYVASKPYVSKKKKR